MSDDDSNDDGTMKAVSDIARDKTDTSDTSVSMTLTHVLMRSAENKKGLRRKALTIVTMSSGETMNETFPNWQKLCLYGPPSQRKYMPYDLNMPLTVPKRPAADYYQDPSLTEHGKLCSAIIASGLIKHKLNFKVVYAAPEFAVVQSAHAAISVKKNREVLFRIEPSLANWGGIRKAFCYFNLDEFERLGYCIDRDYIPLMQVSDLVAEEKPLQYHNRVTNFYSWLFKNGDTCALVVAHESTIRIAEDGLCESGKELTAMEKNRTSCRIHALRLSPNYDLVTLTRPTLPFTRSLAEALERDKKRMTESTDSED